jgi:hypothetical protein
VANNKLRSRVWSTHRWTMDRDFSWNQTVTYLWRFSCGHQKSTKIETVPKTIWMPIVPKYKN